MATCDEGCGAQWSKATGSAWGARGRRATGIRQGSAGRRRGRGRRCRLGIIGESVKFPPGRNKMLIDQFPHYLRIRVKKVLKKEGSILKTNPLGAKGANHCLVVADLSRTES